MSNPQITIDTFIRKVPLSNDPHYYKPLTLPLADAIRYSSVYGPLADEKPERHPDFSMTDHGNYKRSQLKCRIRKRDKSKLANLNYKIIL